MSQHILCAAIWYDDDVIRPHLPKNIRAGIVVAGVRHSNCISQLAAFYPNKEYKNSMIQGFLTSKNIFLDRNEAMRLAFRSCQLRLPLLHTLEDDLYSEDIY